MAITTQKDARTRKEFLEASGVVDAVYLNELKNPKTYAGGKSGAWTPTHSVSIVVDGDKISLGLFEPTEQRPAPTAKDADDKYHPIAKGASVSIVITEGEPYNGKPQYSGFTGDVLILNPAPANVPAAGAASAPYQKKDITGVKVGHAINVALNVIGLNDPSDIIQAAKDANDLTEKLRAEYKEKNPSLSDYDLGASVGQAVLSASQYVENVADIEDFARQTLDVIAPAVTEYIKAQGAPAKPKVATKTPASKTTKKATVKPAAKAVEDDAPKSGFDDMDDDIPF